MISPPLLVENVMAIVNMQPWLPRVVIVGAGFGGLEAAKRLAGAPLGVTVIDRRNYHLFQPLLYQVATAALSPAESQLRSGASCAVRRTAASSWRG